jgi:hypothetical protein
VPSSEPHLAKVTLVHVRLWQAGQVMRRSNLRPGIQMPMGIWSSKKVMNPTRVTAPQLEQATTNLPLGGNGSFATAAGPSSSPAGVAAEYRACLPAGLACRR